MNEEEIRILKNNFKKNSYRNRLMWLNAGNQAGSAQIEICDRLMKEFPDDVLIGLEVGSAYGGGVEFMAKYWYGRSKVYGYDTFEGHPKDLADNQKDMEAYCMEMWYEKGDKIPELSVLRLSYDYQRRVLDEEGLENAILVKGRINEHSFDDIERIHLAMIDLDLIKPTITAYNAIKDKFVPCSYLFLHDALPSDHLPKIYDFVYNTILKDGRWSIAYELPLGNVTILKRKL